VFCFAAVAVLVEWPRIAAAKAAGKVHFNAPVLLANALAAFALNLVRAAAIAAVQLPFQHRQHQQHYVMYAAAEVTRAPHLV
jgi:hypothetical protein